MFDHSANGTPPSVEQTGRRWLPLAGVWCLYTAFGLNMASLAPLVAEIEADLDIGHSQMGTILGVWQVIYIVAAVPCGLLLDRISGRFALVLGGLLMAASALGRSYASDYWEFLFAVALFGLGGPIISAGAPKIVSEWFRGRQRGLAMGIYITGPGIGTIVCFTLTNSVLMPWADQDWRLVLCLWAGFTLLATAVWFVLASFSGQAVVARLRQGVGGAGIGYLLSQPGVRLLMLMSIGVLTISHGLGNWLPEIFRAGGMTPEHAGYWAAVPVGLAIIGALVIPRLAIPQHRYHVLRGLFLMTAVGCGLYASVGSGPWFLVGLVLHGTASASMMTVLILTLVELPGVGERRAGTATGLFFSAAEVGGVAGPVTLGILYDMTAGFSAGLGLLAGIGCALFFSVSLLNKRVKQIT